ncbi:hypothetical protein [Stutzerimonas stutzeri]|uniref:hypothetical protein n=1 Tax=Stutzerimonas stutzeri TaxID=316 RepID=UPI000F6FA486|nr:hypothetical protein [Stutzerimonas stutzeri]AZL50101.1 hypothetical protein CXB48_21650 [Stutzerimonas stutzeri]
MKEIDWSRAPEDATHWHDEYDCYAACWVKEQEGQRYYARADSEWITWNKDRNPLPIDKCIPRPAAQPAWSGEGLPPVGAVCEYQRNDVSYRQEWVRVTPKYFGKEMVVLEHSASGEEYVEQAASCVFRPTRTPEQIAAEELKAAIDEMSEVTQGAHDWLQAFQKLHLAGYRKVTP